MTARLGALVLLLTLGAAAAFGLLALREGERAAGLAGVQAAWEQAEAVYTAASAAVRERDLTYVALMQDPATAAAMRPLIAGARAAAEPPPAVARASVDWPSGEIDALRTQVDAALSAAGTAQAEALAEPWMAAATTRVERLLRLADALATGATGASDPGLPLQRARRATAHLAERFGYDRVLLAGAAIAGRPLTGEQNAERALAAAGVVLALREIEALQDAAVLPEAGRAAIERMWGSLGGGFEGLRSAMVAAARGEGGFPAAAELWLERSAAVLDDIDRAGAALGRVSAERTVSARSAYRGEVAIHATLALTALMLGVLAFMSRRTPPPSPVQALPAPVEAPAKDEVAAAFAAAAISALQVLDTARHRAADAMTLASERLAEAGDEGDEAMRAVMEAMEDLRIAGETVAERLQALGRHFDEAG